MLRVGLTGGIGAGKSAVSRLLASYGAEVLDADLLAREVVEPGSGGLAAVVDEFGAGVLLAGGGLDRGALGQLVFGEPARLARLNAILHPRIAALTRERVAAAEAAGAAVLVHDVPLLAENGLAPAYHLVVVVQAPEAVRLERLVRQRGMAPDEARRRIDAQAGDEQRRAVADEVIDNEGTPAELSERVRARWDGRVAPYAEHVAAGRPAPRGPVRLIAWDPGWAVAGERLVARLRHLCGERAVAVEHIGSTAVSGLPGKDVIDLQVEVADEQGLDAVRVPLAAGGFPRRDDVLGDPPRPQIDPDPRQWRKRIHLSADPGRPANVHVRMAGTAGARCAGALRDLLRADPAARSAYGEAKRQLAVLHAEHLAEGDVDAYSEAKTAVIVPLLIRALSDQGPGVRP